jgi:hypothetical protein
VLTIRTAGQPERQVKVLQVTGFPGGEPLADLQDLTTGARYTVPAKMLTAMAKPAAPKAAPVPPTQWSTTPAAYNPFTRPRYAARDDRSVSRTPPVVTANPSAVSAAPSPIQKPLPAPEPLAQERPLPPPVEPVVFRTAADAPPAPRVDVSVEPPQPAVTVVRAVAPPSAPPPMLRRASLVADPVPLHVAPGLPAPVGDPMAEETGPYLADLFGALRPTVRERAATALAECRYGSRPEVKAQLAKAAADDPCPDVRAHCVGLLSRLGYHESRYLDELTAWAESGPPSLRQAARDALAKLAARN